MEIPNTEKVMIRMSSNFFFLSARMAAKIGKHFIYLSANRPCWRKVVCPHFRKSKKGMVRLAFSVIFGFTY